MKTPPTSHKHTTIAIPTGIRTCDPRPLALRVPSLTTPPIRHLYLVWIFVLLILCLSDFKMSIWDPRQIQMKKLSTIKFYNLLRSRTFILVVSPSKVVYKIWISNLRNSNVVFYDKMISNEEVVNYKVKRPNFREGKSTESKCNKTVVDHITQIPIKYHIHTM